MFRSTALTLETWRALYHRQRIPRYEALRRYVKAVERKQIATQRQQQQNQTGKSAAAGGGAAAAWTSTITHVPDNSAMSEQQRVFGDSGANQKVAHKYNRFFVNDSWNFVATEVFTEDPDVIAKRRATLPEPTQTDLWQKPRTPFFEPFAPFLRVVDYAKDPDFKTMKPTNLPRWKDFMFRRRSPMVPRTWY